jgi:hypothetical protein
MSKMGNAIKVANIVILIRLVLIVVGATVDGEHGIALR